MRAGVAGNHCAGLLRLCSGDLGASARHKLLCAQLSMLQTSGSTVGVARSWSVLTRGLRDMFWPAGMFGFFFCEGPIENYEQAAEKADTAKFAKFHRGMLEEGVYLAPSQFEAGFTGLQHTEADIDATIAAAKRVFARI